MHPPLLGDIWPGRRLEVRVGEDLRATEPLPRCPRCGALARPNMLMFGDFVWVSDRSDEQEARYRRWLNARFQGLGSNVVVLECGAGNAIPTVRNESEAVACRAGATLVASTRTSPRGRPRPSRWRWGAGGHPGHRRAGGDRVRGAAGR